MEIKNKKESIDYWNRNAEKWERFGLGPKGDNVEFPTSWQRGKIVIDEIVKQDKGGDASILDLGCADGALLMALIDNGYCNVNGIDNSETMINEARKRLKLKSTTLSEEDIFVLGDVDSLTLPGYYDFISAMGLIEYLVDAKSFFVNLSTVFATSSL